MKSSDIEYYIFYMCIIIIALIMLIFVNEINMRDRYKKYY